METKEKVVLVLNQIRDKCKEEGLEISQKEGCSAFNVGNVYIEFDGSFDMGRFGRQEKDWITMRSWIDNKTQNRRVRFGDKKVVEKSIEKIKELVELNKESEDRKKMKNEEEQKWKEELKKKFGNVSGFSYRVFAKEFEVLIEGETPERRYPFNLVVEESCGKYKIRSCNKGISENQLKRIVEILKEVEN